jgi:hypothetical protein
MTMQKLRKQLHISGLNMISECGYRFMFRYMLGIKRPPSAYMLVGSATDESVTRNLDAKIQTKELLPRPEAIGIAEAKFDQEKAKEPIELDPDEKREGKSLKTVLGEARDKSINLSGLHYDQAAPQFRPAAVRRRFAVDLDRFLYARAKALHQQADIATERHAAKLLHDQASKLNAAAREGLDFAGEIDIQETYGEFQIVRDTKTSAKSPVKSLMDGSPKPGIADDSEQLTGYALALKVLNGKLPDWMVLDYLVQTPKARDLKYVPTLTKRTEEDMNVFLNRFANAVQAIRTGMFVPANPTWWGCSEMYCGYWQQCPMAKRPKLIQVTKEVPSDTHGDVA